MDILTIENDLHATTPGKLLAALQTWEHWRLIQRVAEREYGISSSEFDVLLPEYQKFLVLAGLSQGMGMFSVRVDKLWHAHVLYLSLYEECCARYFGRMLYHTPNLRSVAASECSTPEDVCTDKPCGVCKTDPGKCTEGECDEECDTRAETREHTAPTFFAAYHAAFGDLPPNIWTQPASIKQS